MRAHQGNKNSGKLEPTLRAKSKADLPRTNKRAEDIQSLYFGSYIRKDTTNLVDNNHKMLNIQFSVSRTCPLEGRAAPDWMQRLRRLKCYVLPFENRMIERNRMMMLEGANLLLKKLKRHLLSDRAFKFKEEKVIKSKSNINAYEPKPLEVETLLENYRKTDNVKTFILKCLKDRRLSVLLQEAVQAASEEERAAMAASITARDLELYLSIPKGMFFITRLMDGCPWFREYATQLCRVNFWALVSAEMTSKLIIHLTETTAEFRAFVFQTARQSMQGFLQSFTATYVLTIAIKVAASDEEYLFLLDMSRRYLKSLLQIKYFKRILVSFLEYCSTKRLEDMYRILSVEKDFFSFLKDKFLTFILLMFLKRDFRDFIAYICETITTKIHILQRSKYFPFFMTKILSINNRDLKKSIHASLLLVPGSALLDIGRYDTFFYFYCYCVLAAVDRVEPLEPQRSMQLLESAFGLAEEFDVTLYP